MFLMERFRVIPQGQLSERDFDDFPVWSEHYDYEEIEDIERWGLDRDTILRLFEKNSPGNEHCVYTLLESNPFPERKRIFIRAKLKTASGVYLKGYVMNENAFCLGVFRGGLEFIFSRHPLLGEENKNHEVELANSLGVNPGNIFPVTYETEFMAKNGKQIVGEFMYGQKET